MMKALVLALACILILATAAQSSVSVRLGRERFYGNLYEDCGDSRPPSAGLFGVQVHIRNMYVFNIDFGGEYSSKDYIVNCGNEGYATSFRHYSVSANASLDLDVTALVDFYGGGGLSYDWFDRSGVPQQESTVSSLGIQVMGGVATTLDIPVNGYLEARYRWLGGDVGVNTASFYIGLEFG
jgi:opacity protein-like surface antigen